MKAGVAAKGLRPDDNGHRVAIQVLSAWQDAAWQNTGTDVNNR